ncbi:hypothetical protein KIPB_012963, partial [Kipferlia bialata]
LSFSDDGYLFAVGADRSVRVIASKELAYVTPLFGHGGPINAVSALTSSRAVSVGGLGDRKLAFWKTSVKKALFFPHEHPMTGVTAVTDGLFVTGDNIGGLQLWDSRRKSKQAVARHVTRPHLDTVEGQAVPEGQEAPISPIRAEISALSGIRGSDIVVSGAGDGRVRVWRVEEYKFTHIADLPVPGFVTSVAVALCNLPTQAKGERTQGKKVRRFNICVVYIVV